MQNLFMVARRGVRRVESGKTDDDTGRDSEVRNSGQLSQRSKWGWSSEKPARLGDVREVVVVEINFGSSWRSRNGA